MSKIIKKTQINNDYLYDICMPKIHNFVANNIIVHNCDFSLQEPVREYLMEKYGVDRVMRIGTFQTLRTLSTIKDVTKILHPELDFVNVNKVTKSFGLRKQEETEEEFYARNKEDNNTAMIFFEKYPDVLKEVDRLIGYNRQASIHPCGVSITQDSIYNFAPVRINRNTKILDFTAGDCEKSGIIKYDILGLKTLKYIQRCCELIKMKDIYQIPLDDKDTFKAFIKGDTASVFQFNSDVAINILSRLPLEKMSLWVLSMVTALGRPGPMKNKQHEEFIKRINNNVPSKAPHLALENELKETYGIMIYQENVMKASQILGGFDLAEADDIRRAMGKKKASVLVPYKNKFITNCHLNYPDTTAIYQDKITIAEHIWGLMETFSGYGFCQAHALSYALIGYYCQYLKVHHPLEWWTSCLEFADASHLRDFYSACKDLCLGVSINKSTDVYQIVDGKIQMPFSCIKGLGPKACEEINKCRPFSSFEDFFKRVNKTKVNKGIVEKLIFSGCFSPFGSEIDLINKYYEMRKDKVPVELASITNAKLIELKAKYLSFMEVDYYTTFPQLFPDNEISYFEDVKVGDKITLGGKIINVKKKETKTKKEYCDVILENKGEELSIRLWSENYSIYKARLQIGSIIKIDCKVDEYNGYAQVIGNCVYTLKDI